MLHKIVHEILLIYRLCKSAFFLKREYLNQKTEITEKQLHSLSADVWEILLFKFYESFDCFKMS